MTTPELHDDVVSQLVPELFGAPLVGDVVPLRGGLESAVVKLTVGGEKTRRYVVKRLDGVARREALRYRLLEETRVTPRLAAVADRDDSTYLFLEPVRSTRAWPWRESGNTQLVLEQLARVHAMTHLVPEVKDWDYDADLRASAAEVLQTAEEAARKGLPELRRYLTPLRRVVSNLDAARQQMFEVLGTTLIHGDAHTGNIVLRGGKVVLLDWGRSRAGSPLEDVSSWLLSLRYWEPAAGRDHDSLFRAYLVAAGVSPALTPRMRDAYWIAAASNMLAGALRYHILSGQSAQARYALRIIRRADARMRG